MRTNLACNKLNYLLAFIFLNLFIGCTKEEIIEIDVDPQLKISVTNQKNISLDGVTVKLYNSEEDFLSDNNIVQSKQTDSAGNVLFQNLSEDIYFFYAEKGELNNYFEVVTFEKPLNKNEIRTITCIIR